MINVVTIAATSAAAVCTGADPAITNVTSAPNASGEGDSSRYALTVTIRNVGTKSQSPDVLQSVVIQLDGAKNGEKGIPPLKAGQSYNFTYDVLRAEGAGPGTTTVRPKLVMTKPYGPGRRIARPRTIHIG